MHLPARILVTESLPDQNPLPDDRTVGTAHHSPIKRRRSSVDLPSAASDSVVMELVREQFAANLRRHRTRVGLSQEALADVCDLHRTEISLLERCKRSPRLETIVILSRGLDLASPAELLDGIS